MHQSWRAPHCAMRSSTSSRLSVSTTSPSRDSPGRRKRAWLAATPGARRHHGGKVRRRQEVPMLGGKRGQDALLVPRTPWVRNVVELLVELNGRLGGAVLETSQAAGVDVQHFGDQRHVAGG